MIRPPLLSQLRQHRRRHRNRLRPPELRRARGTPSRRQSLRQAVWIGLWGAQYGLVSQVHSPCVRGGSAIALKFSAATPRLRVFRLQPGGEAQGQGSGPMFLELATHMLHLRRVQHAVACSVLQVLPAAAWAEVAFRFRSVLHAIACFSQFFVVFITKSP